MKDAYTPDHTYRGNGIQGLVLNPHHARPENKMAIVDCRKNTPEPIHLRIVTGEFGDNKN